MQQIKKICLLFTACILAMSVIISGCGSKDEDKAEETTVLTKEKAFEVLLKNHFGLEPDEETVKQGYISVNDEYSIHGLDDVTICGVKFYRFEQVSLGATGAASTYLVSKNTAAIYGDGSYDFLEEFDLDSLPYHLVGNTKIYELEYLYPDHSYNSYINGETGVFYDDLDVAMGDVINELADSDVLVDLIGKDISYAENITGQKAIIELVEAEFALPGEDAYDEFTVIECNNYKVYTYFDNEVSYILLEKGAEVLGVSVGMTIPEIKAVLGTPHHEGNDDWAGLYEMYYLINDKRVGFYAETSESATVSGYVAGP
ncbi:hypothetical protein [Desulfofalx alkaliphila]|uniref:hypothetical protein n=1 Tax=Desulfofalx alkaliphila TaxID=105483 RepID=UPI0004E1E62D|nr:hypothetical protein [Desulfofalx alkaliphila]